MKTRLIPLLLGGVLASNLLAIALYSADFSETIAQTDAESSYRITAQDGFLCVYNGEAFLYSTDIPLDTLPESDRLLLQEGIYVQTREQLAERMEDFGA